MGGMKLLDQTKISGLIDTYMDT